MKIFYKCIIMNLPTEIKYEILKWLNPLDTINTCNVFNIMMPKNGLNEIDDFIEKLSDGNELYKSILHSVINKKNVINYDILKVLKDVCYIIKRTRKYMDLLGFDIYIFQIKQGSYYIIKEGIPIIHNDTQIINIIYPDIKLLKKYIHEFLNFKQGNENHSIYKVKNYKLICNFLK